MASAACVAHVGTDPQGRCAARVESASAGYSGRCHAGPLIRCPFCWNHDPAERELRRLERESARVQVEATRALLARVNPEIRARALEVLVRRKRITLEDMREVLRPYLDRQLAVMAIGDEEGDEADGH